MKIPYYPFDFDKHSKCLEGRLTDTEVNQLIKVAFEELEKDPKKIDISLSSGNTTVQIMRMSSDDEGNGQYWNVTVYQDYHEYRIYDSEECQQVYEKTVKATNDYFSRKVIGTL